MNTFKERVIEGFARCVRLALPGREDSDIARALEQIVEPLFGAAVNMHASRFDAYSAVLGGIEELDDDDPSVKYAEGWEAGVQHCEAILKMALHRIATSTVGRHTEVDG